MKYKIEINLLSVITFDKEATQITITLKLSMMDISVLESQKKKTVKHLTVYKQKVTKGNLL